MKTRHDLLGLMKFITRDTWREDFQAVIEAHFGAVLEKTELDFDDLGDILGDHWPMILWGCAFEDALSQEFADGRNPADDYLKRRGWKESAQAKSYIRALRTSIMSLYEASEIVPGQSFLARDLLRGGEPVLVHEGTATTTLRPWEKIAARIVTVADRNILTGGLLPFSPGATDMLMDAMRQLTGRTKRSRAKLRLENDVLRGGAPLFTIAWLMDALPKALGMGLPELRNRDGEEIVFHDVRFPLTEGTAPDDVVAVLAGIPALEPANERFWNWLETKPAKPLRKAKDPETLSLEVTMEDGVPVLGTLELKDRVLILGVNSSARAAKGTEFFGKALGPLVRTPLTSIQTTEQIMASRAGEPEPKEPGLPPEVEARLVHDMLDRQYRILLDEPVPMLGNTSPRAAAETKAGRVRVAEWLKYLERESARHPDPANPMASYDFVWIWRELKVENLRR